MIPEVQQRSVATGGVLAEREFQISAQDSPHVQAILRSHLYSDKVLAVLREYSANAWDAHREAGTPNLPIQVRLPTVIEPLLEIKDFGKGLSEEQMFDVFVWFGRSTKRASNQEVGCFGIGCKSGHAYSDAFTIVSRHGGRQRVYVAALQEDGHSKLSLISDTQASEGDTGLTIQIPVAAGDVRAFQEKARALFQWMDPLPTVTVGENPFPIDPPTGVVVGPDLVRSNGGFWAVMGCVPYPVDLAQIDVPPYVRRFGAVLRFGIGELQVAASREQLRYTERTKRALAERAIRVIDEYFDQLLRNILAEDKTNWERRKLAAPLRNHQLPQVKRELSWLLEHPVPLSFEEQSGLRFQASNGAFSLVNRAQVPNSRLVIRDVHSQEKYHIRYDDVVIVPPKGHPEGVELDLSAFCAAHRIDGIEIVRMSTLPKVESRQPVVRERAYNKKHRVSCFQLLNSADFEIKHTWSQNWEVVDREMEDSDVYVRLDKFRNRLLEENWTLDSAMIRFFGLDVPRIYGYKQGALDTTPLGVDYETFRKDLWGRLSAANPEGARKLLRAGRIGVCFDFCDSQYGRVQRLSEPSDLALEVMLAALGEDHPIYDLATGVKNGWETLEANRDLAIQVHRLVDKIELPIRGADLELEYQNALQALFGEAVVRWPLLGTQDQSVSVLWGKHATQWLEYVKNWKKPRTKEPK